MVTEIQTESMEHTSRIIFSTKYPRLLEFPGLTKDSGAIFDSEQQIYIPIEEFKEKYHPANKLIETRR